MLQVLYIYFGIRVLLVQLSDPFSGVSILESRCSGLFRFGQVVALIWYMAIGCYHFGALLQSQLCFHHYVLFSWSELFDVEC